MLRLLREPSNSVCTLGTLYFDDEFLCDTLEDIDRSGEDEILQKTEKVYGETCIGMGTFDVVMAQSARYKRLMPHLLDTPFFTDIMLHWGNWASNSIGCILVGERIPTRIDMITKSRWTFENVVLPQITTALTKGKLFIEITKASHL